MAPTLVDCTATGVAKPRLPHMPENIWLDIFGYLSLEEKVRLSRTCRTWYRIVDDPSLYTHIHLDHMEFDTLVKSMHHLVRRAPRIRSLRISNCFSAFISRTTVPVQNTPALHNPFAAAVAAVATATAVVDSANVSDGAVSDAAAATPSAMTPSSPVSFAPEATTATMTSTQSPPSPPPQFGLHSLHTHITSFTLPRRREEYRKLGFTLHQEFSRALVILMEQSQESLSRLEIQDNFLDLEMTELIFCIVRYGRHLERLLYDGNRDGGFVAPEVVSAITAACPNIRSFRGKHAISDTVLRRMLSGWEQLRSITLAPFHSPALGPKEISLEGLWSLLECSQVERLELLDLDCLSNENLAKLVERVKQLEALSIDRWRSSTLPLSTSSAHAHPLAHHGIRFPSNNNSSVDASMSRPGSPATTTRPLPGASVRHLTLTKFTSMPLTLPGFGLLLKLFPNLETLVFTTNYFAYDHQFRGLTKEIYETEVEMVERTVQAEMVARWGNAVMSPVLSSVSSWSWPNGIKSSSLPSQTPAAASFPWLDMRLRWKADWNAPWTEEQRLRAGIMRA